MEGLVLRSVRRTAAVGIGLVGVVILGWVDYISGEEISVSIFYLAPIMYAAWHGGPVAGIGVSVAAAAVWLWLEAMVSTGRLPQPIFLWNGGVRLGFFLIAAFLLIRLRELLDQAELSARTDPLTGLPNRRAFLERLEVESRRARRYDRPLSLAYLDLDDFKRFNDTLGHEEGDRILAEFGRALRDAVRVTDLPARMGGDEFALILPETGAVGARQALEKVRSRLAAGAGPAPGFSTGLQTWSRPPAELAEAVQAVDTLMYRVKDAGKGGLVHEEDDAAPA